MDAQSRKTRRSATGPRVPRHPYEQQEHLMTKTLPTRRKRVETNSYHSHHGLKYLRYIPQNENQVSALIASMKF